MVHSHLHSITKNQATVSQYNLATSDSAENFSFCLKSKKGAKYLSIEKISVTQFHRRRLLILAGGAETRNEKQLHTNFSKLSVKNAVWFFD